MSNLCDRQLVALATGMNCTKTMQQWTLTCSGLQLARRLDSQEDIVWAIVTEVVDSAFGFLPSQILRERG